MTGMGSDAPHDNSPSQPVKKSWNILQNVSAGNQITVNGIDAVITIETIRPNADAGSTTEITGHDENNRTYTISVPNNTIAYAVLNSPANNIEDEPITTVTPAPHEILHSTTARELYGRTITDVGSDPTDTYPEQRDQTPALDTDTLTIIGDCPQCSCLVTEDSGNAICTNCGAWATIEEWEYYNEMHGTTQTTDSDENNSTTTETQTDLSTF